MTEMNIKCHLGLNCDAEYRNINMLELKENDGIATLGVFKYVNKMYTHHFTSILSVCMELVYIEMCVKKFCN